MEQQEEVVEKQDQELVDLVEDELPETQDPTSSADMDDAIMLVPDTR